MADNFTLFGPARWTPADRSRTFALALVQNDTSHERRLVERKRPRVDGAPHDDSGSDANPHRLRAIFCNNHGVAGVPDPAYPQYHRDFLDALEQKGKGTSTLYSPGRGEKKVVFRRFDTSQLPDRRDCEFVDLTFIETKDDERATAGSFSLPNAKTAGPVIARQLAADGHAIGIGSDLFDQLGALVTAVNAAANAPFDSAGALQQRVDGLLGSIDRLEGNLLRGPLRFGDGASSPLLSPEAASVSLGLALLKDTAHRQNSATFGEASVVPRTFAVTLSIFDIASRLGQDANELVTLNARRLPSLFAIPPGFPVLVKAA